MGDNLEERLKSHARAFEGLMSLIPAKDYYGKDESITSVCMSSPPCPALC
ncbi:ribosome biogenesis protein rrp14-c [Pyrenophora tritici-repentis]|nr:ribosome biogenesis protein rrp14-c [Pyrenophora tritici-repentis]